MVLLTALGVGGATVIGAIIGMYGFRHKTKHMKFIILVPLALIVHLAFFTLCLIAALT